MDKTDKKVTVQELKDAIEKFIADREWQQFHNAKNLSMAISVEAAELMEHFLWIDPKDVDEHLDKKREDVEDEVVDIAWMILCLCNRYNIDLSAAIERKAQKNAAKYPVEKSKGRSTKYTEL